MKEKVLWHYSASAQNAMKNYNLFMKLMSKAIKLAPSTVKFTSPDIEDLERKLAKAVEALKHYSNEEDNETYLDVFDCIKVKGSCTEFDDVKFGKVARETLAELEGE